MFGMGNNTRLHGIGVDIEHHSEQMVLVFNFRGSGTVVGHLALSMVFGIIVGAKLGMGVPHPIAQCFNSTLILVALASSNGSRFVDVVSHKTETMQ